MKLLKLGMVGMILLVLTLSLISSLGVTPGRTTFNYLDNLDQTFSFKVLNSENKDMKVSIFTEGELGENINLNENIYEFSSGEDFKIFYYSLNITIQELDPGKHVGKIIVHEENIDEELFGAKVAVSTEILLLIPYPDKYLESAIEINDKNENITFLIPIINRGKEDMDDVRANIIIYHEEEKVGEVSSESVPLKSLQRDELVADWDADVPLGNYKAKITISYDNVTVSFYEMFKVGELALDIFDLFVEDFELGNIVEMGILVENKWSESVNGVYARMVLYNDSGKVVDISSSPQDIAALSETRLHLYWDTSGIVEGKYSGKIIINYKEFSSEKEILVDISKYGIGIELDPGKFVLEKKINFLEVVYLTLILLGVIFLIIFKKFKNKK